MTTNLSIPVFIFGIGNVGSALIKQIETRFLKTNLKSSFNLKIVCIANSKKVLFNPDGLASEDLNKLESHGFSYSFKDVIAFSTQNQYQNPILVDATASSDFVSNYISYINAGFHFVAANKKANTLPFDEYKNLKTEFKKNNRFFQYETNVGAGLPIIQTLTDLKQTQEKVLKITGVFSGSLSYIFNKFSSENITFTEAVNAAAFKGLTEPDPREDLSGQDVARKLLILARELGYSFDLSDVKITSLLVPEIGLDVSLGIYQANQTLLNQPFNVAKKAQKEGHVLRYVGVFDIQNQQLEAKLVSVPQSTPLGQLQGTSNFFEITTEVYQENPIIIQGPGAGKEVTALGVLSDIVKISKTIIYQETPTLAGAFH